MNILLHSYTFSPSVGGIESVSRLLAEEFVHLGHATRVITNTPCIDSAKEPFVLRRPSIQESIQAFDWCDVCLQNHLSFRLAWPAWIRLAKPLFVIVQTWINFSGPVGTVRRALLHRFRQLAISKAIANHLPNCLSVIGNPYNERIFRNHRRKRTGIAFVGRLVDGKGVDVLIDAWQLARRKGLDCPLTIAGNGPLAPRLQARAKQLSGAVRMAGSLDQSQLSDLLNESLILVVPSLWEEPFGIVALEGLACGCKLVAFRRGGLPEATGEFCHFALDTNASSLGDVMLDALNAREYDSLRLDQHLRYFTARATAQRLLECIHYYS